MKMSSIGGGGGGGGGSGAGADGGNRNNRNNYSYSFPQFSLRRFLLESARAARGSPPLSARLCDMERANNVKYDKNHSSSSSSSNNNNNNNNNNNHNATAINGTPMASSSTQHHVHPQHQLPYHLPHHHHHLHKNNADNASQNSVSSPSNCTASSNHQRVLASPLPDLQSDTFCPVCYNEVPPNELYTLLSCKHLACLNCLESYLMIEIFESRTDIACPQCTDSMHPSDIQAILKAHPEFVNKYEDFMVRRVLLNDTDSRWCPAPDCSYAVIATGCASCPRIKCERPGCDVNFCYHCKAEWHPDQTCDAARASRQSPMRAPSGSISQDSQHRDDIKPCPRCQVLIVKMDDGSCNHMVCAVCGSEFCWLCMKEVSDLHYLSPSGCTFWGKKPWSRKKKLLWQLGTLVGAPVGIALVAGIAVPAMIIGIPVWVGRKIHEKYKTDGKHKRNSAVLGGVTASILVSPVLAGLAVAIGVPILLFYVYGVVPVSLCRAGCGVSTSRDGFKFDVDEDDTNSRNQDAGSVDAISRIGATSIGEFSLSVASGSHLGVSSGGVGLGGGISGGGGGGGAIGGGSGFGGMGGTGGTSGLCGANGDNSNGAIVGSNGGNNGGGTHQPFQIIGHSSKCESTTALAGSITGHRLEVQADVSSSETASAVTCVSEKSTNALNDTASTRALAGSILSYKQQLDSSNVSEDGVSERVHFDSTICYVGDGKKEHLSDIPFIPPQLDQDIAGGDKTSVSSGRSFRSSERSYRDEMDSTSLSSAYNNPIINNNNNNNKRTSIFSRIPKLNSSQHRNLSLDGKKGSKNIPDFESPEFLHHIHHHLQQQQQQQPTPNHYQHHHSHHQRQHHPAQPYNNNNHHKHNNNNNNHHQQTYDNNQKLSNLHNNDNNNTNSNYCSNSDKQSFINVPYNNLNDSLYKDVYSTGGSISSTINNKSTNATISNSSKQQDCNGDNTNIAPSSSSSTVANRKNSKSQINHKNMSKVAILRNLFFSKNNNPNDFDDDDDNNNSNNNNNNDSASNSKS